MAFTRTVRVLAFVLAATLGWSLWATCAEAAMLTPAEQMACCKDGEFKCAAHGNATDCCNTDASRHHDAITVAKAERAHVLAPVAVWAALPVLSQALVVHARSIDPAFSPHREPSPPPYIAFSSLLI